MMKHSVLRIVTITATAMIVAVSATVGFVYLAPEVATQLLQNARREAAGIERREMRLTDGLHYVYLEGGQGEPLMLLHGFGGNKDHFTPVARHLKTHYRVIVPDHIGFGESSRPVVADYSPPEQARRLRILAQALGAGRLHLGGNSMGGHIALTYAALYPNEVKSLWLLAPGGIWSAPKTPAAASFLATGHNPLLVQSDDDLVKLLRLVMSNPPFIPRPILSVAAKQRIDNYKLEERIVKAIMADAVEQRVTGLATPALILWGSEDQVLSVKAAEILARLMPRSQTTVMQHIGHMPMLENPEGSAQYYLRFRASLQH